MDIANLIQTVAIYALPVLFAITVHEAAHGYAARHFGDNTAWQLGRVTLNPVAHIDPVGTLLMPLTILLFSMLLGASSFFLFGYAKPVPVRIDKLRNPKSDMVWVALAGPMANLIQTLFWGVLMYALQAGGVEEMYFYAVCKAGIAINVSLFAFNLFPLPPLDGGRILAGLLPLKQAMAFSRLEPYGIFIVVALVYLRVLDTFWMRPLVGLTMTLVDLLLSPLAAVLR